MGDMRGRMEYKGLMDRRNLMDWANHSTLMTFDTTKAGSAATHLILPFVNGGTYACTILWGDGSSNYVTAWNDAALDHTYATAGTYDVEIVGTCNGFRYNDGGDKLKLMVIKRWGKDFCLGNTNAYFLGCANLTITATDILNLAGTLVLYSLFDGCSSLVNIPSMNSWNTANVTNMRRMFAGCTVFNQSVVSFNTTNVTDMYAMFNNCTAFNQDVSGFNVAKVTAMDSMFEGANSLSTANYDALLISWAAQTVKPNVSFHAGDAKYSAGAAATARGVLTGAPNTWTVTDGGQV